MPACSRRTRQHDRSFLDLMRGVVDVRAFNPSRGNDASALAGQQVAGMDRRSPGRLLCQIHHSRSVTVPAFGRVIGLQPRPLMPREFETLIQKLLPRADRAGSRWAETSERVNPALNRNRLDGDRGPVPSSRGAKRRGDPGQPLAAVAQVSSTAVGEAGGELIPAAEESHPPVVPAKAGIHETRGDDEFHLNGNWYKTTS